MRSPRHVAAALDRGERARPRRRNRDRRQPAEADHGVEHQRCVLGAARQRPVHLARIPGERHRMVGDQPRRRTDADDAAERRRDADRAAEIGTLRQRHHGGRHRRRRSARRTSRAERRVPGIAGGAEHRVHGVGAGGEFRRVGLGEHDGAGRLEPAHHLGILGGDVILMERRAESGADPGGRGDVLDCDWEAGERPERIAAHQRRRGGARLLPGALGGERDDGVERGIEPRDHFEMGVEHFDRARLARLDQRGELARRLPHEVGHLPDQCTNRRSTSRNSRLSP